MNILYLSIGTIDNLEKKGIYTDLLRQFRDNGHNVYVVCRNTSEPNKSTIYESKGGAHFLRVKTGSLQSSYIKKGITTIMLEKLYLKAIKDNLNDIKFDLVIYATPPITFAKVIQYVKKRDNAKSYLLLKDIFPQNAVDLNMFSKINPVYAYFRQKEKKLYKQSDFIGCMSQANVDYVLNNNKEAHPEKVEVCPNSIEPTPIKKDETKEKAIRKKYNIPLNRTTFLYGGNLGKPQGINFLIRCIEANKNNKNVYFVIAGAGSEFNKIQDYLSENNITNAQLFKRLPKEDYEVLATSCDVGLIFLDYRFKIPNFPSRLLSYMNAAKPVLAATDVNTDLGKIIEKGNFGYWCESTDVNEFIKKLNKLCNRNLREKLGANARNYLEQNYTSKHSYEIIMKHFN